MEDEQMPADKGYLRMEDGVRLFFERAGNGGKHLLILNGFYLFEDFRYLADDRTVISLDLRNRGRSDYIADLSKMNRGVVQDVDDIEAVRQHFEIGNLDLLAHSYAALIPILYAIKYPAHVRRAVQIGSMPPNQTTQYPAQLTNVDPVLAAFFTNVAKLQTEVQSLSPPEFCERFWTLLRPIYVFNPNHAARLLHWRGCHLETELNLMAYWTQVLLPSIQKLDFTSEDLGKVSGPVLVVHGTKDRSGPYGGARDWALRLPNARLLTIDNVAHAPWIEAPEKVLGPVRTFLDGEWPEGTEKVESL
jgi:pimeloyl-ACP methyl ester carboxylesterase